MKRKRNIHMRLSKSKTRRAPLNLSIGEYNFEGVRRFKYLGIVINNNNDMNEVIQQRLKSGNKSFYVHVKMLKSKKLSRTMKLRIYKNIIRPIATYGAEIWTMTQKNEQNLLIFERKILRKIFGPERSEDGSYYIRMNHELDQFIEKENIIRCIKSQRIRWLGHLNRMSQDRMPKIVYTKRLIDNRSRGRPTKRWSDEVEDDLKRMGVEGWSALMENRIHWRNIVDEAKVDPGL